MTILAVVRFRIEAIPYAVELYITAAYWFTASTSFANPAVTIARALTNTFRESHCPCAAFPRRADGRRAHRYGPDAMAVAHPGQKSQLVTDLPNIIPRSSNCLTPNTLEARRSPIHRAFCCFTVRSRQRSYRRFLTLEAEWLLKHFGAEIPRLRSAWPAAAGCQPRVIIPRSIAGSGSCFRLA